MTTQIYKFPVPDDGGGQTTKPKSLPWPLSIIQDLIKREKMK